MTINTSKYQDMEIITHPAFYIGKKGNYMLFKDEQDELFFMQLSPGDPGAFFEIGTVMDADELLPVTSSPEAIALITRD